MLLLPPKGKRFQPSDPKLKGPFFSGPKRQRRRRLPIGTIGSHICECYQGYDGNGTYFIGQKLCCLINIFFIFSCFILTSVFIIFIITDRNECNTTTHGCHVNASCNNFDGSYFCQCNQGFTGNGTHCNGIYLHILP